jgi:hypothetical protein
MRRNLPDESRRDWNIGEQLTERKREAKSMRIAQSPVCAEGKRKTTSYKRNELYREQVTQKGRPYWRMYYNGYGGQNSMGTESYQGTVGRKRVTWDLVDEKTPTPEPVERNMRKGKVVEDRSEHVTSARKNLEAGNRVKILTRMFGRQYAQGREKYSYGRVVGIDGNMVNVLYEDDGVEWKSHVTHLSKVAVAATLASSETSDRGSRPIFHAYINGGVRVRSKWFDEEYANEGWFKGSAKNLTILSVLELNAEITSSTKGGPGNLPKDFWQALVSPEWRSWVSAVKAEIESWDLFDAAEEVSFDDMVRGATIIPLGELFTIKRTGKHKFRQIAMGNLMKEGRDYGKPSHLRCQAMVSDGSSL